MASVRLDRVTKRFGATTVVDAIDLSIGEGEFLTLLGPSGCGKTTTLRMIAGFVEPHQGRVYIDAEDVTHLPPQKRGIGMVFQDYALFPHLTVADNIAFGLVERGVPKAARAARVAELLDMIRLPQVAARYPAELSGGQQQRVALARAVAFPPRVLLMDEPLGALDLKLRETMQEELRRIQQALRITTVYVTHDQGEAMRMADRIAVMNGGRIEQLDTPTAIYDAPTTEFVADFVGKINLIRGRPGGREGELLRVGTAAGEIRAPLGQRALDGGTEITVAVRPEHLAIRPPGTTIPQFNHVEARVESQAFFGNVLHIGLRTMDGTSLLAEVRPGETTLANGDGVAALWPIARSVLLAPR